MNGSMNIERIAFAACAFIALSAQGQSLILNGSFESPAIAANSYQHATPTSWSWGSSAGWIFSGSVFDPNEGSYWPSPQNGLQFVDIGNVSSFTLFQSFTVADQGEYQLAWYDNAHSHGLTSPYSVSVFDSSLQPVASVNLDAAHGGVWQNRTLPLNLASGNYRLTFMARGVTRGYDTLLDNISITAVPEPSIWVLVALGTGAFALRKRRRRFSTDMGEWGHDRVKWRKTTEAPT
jgi:hypothetical protein